MTRKLHAVTVPWGLREGCTLLHGSAAGRSQPRASTFSCEANVLRPPKLQHAVQRGDSDRHLGGLPPFGPRAQRVTDDALVAADIRLHQGTPIVTRCPLPAHRPRSA